MGREFNLIDEPWIRVLKRDGGLEEVSILDALVNAADYVCLSGEIAVQDSAVLRFLLAILYSVFARVDVDGGDSPLYEDEDESEDWASEAVARWKEIWDMGAFPRKPVNDYLTKWHDRFWLFGTERPFAQVERAKDVRGTYCDAGKLNGAICESSSKPRIFPERAGKEKKELSFAEAARWLLYLNAFDDTAAKPSQEVKGKGLPSMSKGWVGSLGIVEICGRNFFETLMLNLTMAKNGNEDWEAMTFHDECHLPFWELDKMRDGERTVIPLPQNPAAMLTLQSRRIFLDKCGDKVFGYWLLGGDQINEDRAYSEQMTVWSVRRGKGQEPERVLPRPHQPDKQIWRDFGALTVPQKEKACPGVVAWAGMLKSRQYGCLPKDYLLRFRTPAVRYAGPPSNQVTDGYVDSLSVNAGILEGIGENGGALCRRIADECAICEKAGEAVASLAENLMKASGGENRIRARSDAREELFCRLDRPFRIWLEGLSADTDMEAEITKWRDALKRISMDLGKELVEGVGTVAFVGRKETIGNKESVMTAPLAFRIFRFQLVKILRGEGR